MGVIRKEQKEMYNKILKDTFGYTVGKKLNNYDSFDKILFNTYSNKQRAIELTDLSWKLSTAIYAGLASFNKTRLSSLMPSFNNKTQLAFNLFKRKGNLNFANIIIITPPTADLNFFQKLLLSIRKAYENNKQLASSYKTDKWGDLDFPLTNLYECLKIAADIVKEVPGASLAVDIDGDSNRTETGKYKFDNQKGEVDSDVMVDVLVKLVADFKLTFLVDPLEKRDLMGYKKLFIKLKGACAVVGMRNVNSEPSKIIEV